MIQPVSVWGIHMGEHVGARPVEKGYVAIGWAALGDLRQYPDREALKAALAKHYPDKKSGSRPVDAGILFRFTHEMKAGDIVVYPSKHDRMVNIGRFTGAFEHVADDPHDYPNRRHVEWLGHSPRNDFSQSALNEIGAFISVFLIQGHAGEFLAKIGMAKPMVTTPETGLAEDAPDDDTATVAVSKQAEMTTGDFVIRQIMAKLSGYEFEEFVAHLLECMGYTARVTQRSGDGGVDVIAHRDELGFEPPILKVQCKRKTDQTPRPEVDQLLGTLGEGEYGLFIALGSFSRQSVDLERNRPKLRLIDGEQFVELVLENYARLSPRYRTMIPLKQIYVPDLQG
ncbi:MAG: restriction endonuclease [Notoacmeibacter sp.]|nr:restriction endonuclease [Notoacmeibacter sp.]